MSHWERERLASQVMQTALVLHMLVLMLMTRLMSVLAASQLPSAWADHDLPADIAAKACNGLSLKGCGVASLPCLRLPAGSFCPQALSCSLLLLWSTAFDVSTKAQCKGCCWCHTPDKACHTVRWQYYQSTSKACARVLPTLEVCHWTQRGLGHPLHG